MTTVLKAKLPEKTSTDSHYNADWLDYFELSKLPLENQRFHLPEFINNIISGSKNWIWPGTETETAQTAETRYLDKIDMLDEIPSILMPPKKKYQIKLHITNIKRGRPSFCDEFEL